MVCVSPPIPFSSWVETDDGRSPGRFFANSLLKILLGRIVMMYDIEPLEKRPNNPWLNNTIGPPVGAMMKVRRRKADVDGMVEAKV